MRIKRVLCSVMAIVIAASTVAFADDANIENTFNIDVNYDEGKVKLYGTSTKDENVYIQVLNPGKTIDDTETEEPMTVFNHIEITQAKDGIYSVLYTLDCGEDSDNSGNVYTAYANSDAFDKVLDKDFYFANSTVTATALETLNGYIKEKNTDEIKSFLNSNKDKFFYDSEYLGKVSSDGEENGLKSISNMIIKSGVCEKMSDLKRMVEQYSVIQMLYEEKTNLGCGKILYNNAKALCLNENAPSEYNVLVNEDDAFLEDLGKVLKTERCNTYDAFISLFKTGMCLAGVKNAENVGVIKSVLKRAYDAGVISVPEYFALSSTDGVDIRIIKEDYATAAELETAVKNFAKNVDDSNGGEGASSGGSSGGGGFSKVDVALGSAMPEVKPVTKDTFTDLGETHWSYESVLSLKKANCINGYPDGTFRPENNINRNEFLKIALSAFDIIDENATSSFYDVDNSHWSYIWIATAQKYGIVSGDDNGNFNGELNITREEATKILDGILAFKGLILSNKREFAEFDDFEYVSDYAKECVEKFYCAEIINGVGNNTFMPKKSTTRAEAAKMIFSVMKELAV